MEKRERVNEYDQVEYHKYKGVEFFTALYSELGNIVLEPVHKEVLDMSYMFDSLLWHDSAHTWAKEMTLQEQRKQLVEYAQNDIDLILSGYALKEQRKQYLEKRKKLKEQLEFFKALKKGARKNEVLSEVS